MTVFAHNNKNGQELIYNLYGDNCKLLIKVNKELRPFLILAKYWVSII